MGDLRQRERDPDPRAIRASLLAMVEGTVLPRRRNKTALVRAFSKEIVDLRSSGWSCVEIAERLSGLGLAVTADALRSYLSRIRRAESRVPAAGRPGSSARVAGGSVAPSPERRSVPASRASPAAVQNEPSAFAFVDANESARPFGWLVESVHRHEGNRTHYPMRDGRPGAKDIPVYVPDPAGVRSGEIGSWEALAASRKRGSR